MKLGLEMSRQIDENRIVVDLLSVILIEPSHNHLASATQELAFERLVIAVSIFTLLVFFERLTYACQHLGVHLLLVLVVFFLLFALD